jgi:FkbM family methyltransferase
MSLFSIAKTLKIDKALKSNIYSYQLFRSIVGRINFLLPLEPDFTAFGMLPAGNGMFLDVGANDGISARSFRIFNKTMPILSIEANPCHKMALERTKRSLPFFEYMLVGVGAAHGRMILHTPVFRGIALTAYASIDRPEAERRVCEHMPNASNALRFIETSVEIIPLDDLALTPAFVKIDVEGFELQVLQGMMATIERCRPIFMIEHDGQDRPANSLSILGPLGYRAYLFDSKAGAMRPYTREPAENLFYLPAAKLQ